ncbi:exo-alpha-sialidase [Pasteurella multocida]|nr:exo-alpha-sialidase [Pasteurella multocida]MCL7796273.1 exo-alpha-sialidase [Pasteurella multocida]URI03212.1 exo-alpha-sialidase [Pasteurella multocida]
MKVQKGAGNPTIGFLGGVGTGIVMKDGTLVFPIQTAHRDGIATTIMYSKDNGKTWDMPAINDALAPNQSSLENMVFEIDNKLVMTGREDNRQKTRWAYYTEDLGKTCMFMNQLMVLVRLQRHLHKAHRFM